MFFIKDVFELFFPRQCVCCKQSLTHHENIVCTLCKHHLPLTKFSEISKNELEKSFYGRIPLQAGTALFYFKKRGNVQQIIHHLKYKNRQEIGVFTGKWLAEEIKNGNRFSTIDVVVPVPLQKEKLKKRGYNQVAVFGKTLSKELHCEYCDNVLKRVKSVNSQTHKNRIERWENVKNSFSITDSNYFNNKHILLIDDVITTGATLEACYLALSKSTNSKISIASIAFTQIL